MDIFLRARAVDVVESEDFADISMEDALDGFRESADNELARITNGDEGSRWEMALLRRGLTARRGACPTFQRSVGYAAAVGVACMGRVGRLGVRVSCRSLHI